MNWLVKFAKDFFIDDHGDLRMIFAVPIGIAGILAITFACTAVSECAVN